MKQKLTMKVCLIGGHGFIGHHLFHYIQEKNEENDLFHFDVSIFDTGEPNGKPEPYVVQNRMKGLPDSLTRNELYSTNWDIVVYLASLAGVRNGHSDQDFYDSNVSQLRYDLNKLSAKHVTYISSSSVLGDVETAYSKSKRQAEELMMSFEKFGTKAIVRPFTVYGTNGRPEMFVSQAILSKKTNKMVMVNGGPALIKRRFTYVKDLCDCIFWSFNRDAKINAIGKKAYSLLEVLELVGATYNIKEKCDYDFKSQVLDDAEIYCCTTELEDVINEI